MVDSVRLKVGLAENAVHPLYALYGPDYSICTLMNLGLKKGFTLMQEPASYCFAVCYH